MKTLLLKNSKRLALPALLALEGGSAPGRRPKRSPKKATLYAMGKVAAQKTI
jgi:hypothetical protein